MRCGMFMMHHDLIQRHALQKAIVSVRRLLMATNRFQFCEHHRARRMLYSPSALALSTKPCRPLFVASVANLKPASLLALDDDLAMPLTQFDLAKVTASGIDLLRDEGRAPRAVAGSARRDGSASVNAELLSARDRSSVEASARCPQFPQSGSVPSSALPCFLTVERKSHRQGVL
jgi:hypothetical protein